MANLRSGADGEDSVFRRWPCKVCARLSKRTWPIEDVPEIPYEHCTSDEGCKCGYILGCTRSKRTLELAPPAARLGQRALTPKDPSL